MNRIRIISGGLVLALLASVWASCTLRYDFTECEVDGDCRSIEEPNADKFYICSDNRCVRDPEIDCRKNADCPLAGQTCENQHCVGGMVDAGDTGVDTEQPDVMPDTQSLDTTMNTEPDVSTACQKTSECIKRFEEGYVCSPKGECIDATNTLCPKIEYQNEERDDVIILGAIIPTSKPYKSIGLSLKEAILLAVQEFFGQVRSLPSGEKVALLHCDAKGSGKLTLQAARHLVKVGAPAIIGPMLSQNYLDVVDQVTSNAGVTTIAPAATSPALSNLSAAGDLSFRVISNDTYQANAILDRLDTLLEGDTDPKVTVFFKQDQYGQDLKDQLRDAVIQSSEFNQSNFLFTPVVNPADVMFDEKKIKMDFAAKASTAINQKQPGADVVVFLGTGEQVGLAATYISVAHQAFQQGAQKANPLGKRYLFSHGVVSDLPGLPAELMDNETFLPLSEGVSPDVIDDDNFPLFNSRYSAQFQKKLTVNGAGVAYDAANVALLAMVGVPSNKEITGENIGDVLASNTLDAEMNATTIEFGPSGFQGDAKKALTNGKKLDVQGVSGNLDFDSSGDVRSDYLGIDLAIKEDLNQMIVYDIRPTRLYKLGMRPATKGKWFPIPPGMQGAGVSKMDAPSTTIPDASMQGAAASFNVSQCNRVNVAHLHVDISHPDPTELTLLLDTPGAKDVPLSKPGSGPIPLKGTFPTTLLPVGDYSKLMGESGNGTWTLKMIDGSSAKGGGTLNSWGLSLYCGQ